MRKPRVFVSSTCYDLGQERADLKGFIEGLGYEAVLSDYTSFPVNPDRNTVENSRAAVRDNADIFILVFGGRYGTIDESSGRSITNSEYIEARAAQLPIYAFVDTTVDALLPAWRANRNIEHPSVDSPAVFEFLEELKTSLTWIFPFQRAGDIIETLRVQWSYLFMDALEKRRLLSREDEPQRLGLRGEPLEIATVKPPYWEYRLFLSLLDAELKSRASMKRDLELGFVTKTLERFADLAEFLSWADGQFSASRRLIQKWNRLITELSTAFGPPGQPGDVASIAYVTSRLGALYEASLEWGLSFHQLDVSEDLQQLRDAASHFMDDVLESFQRLTSEFSETVSRAAQGEITGKQRIVWTIDVPQDAIERYEAELEILGRKYGNA